MVKRKRYRFRQGDVIDVGHAGDPGHGQSKADHHGLLHGKVGGTDEKESD